MPCLCSRSCRADHCEPKSEPEARRATSSALLEADHELWATYRAARAAGCGGRPSADGGLLATPLCVASGWGGGRRAAAGGRPDRARCVDGRRWAWKGPRIGRTRPEGLSGTAHRLEALCYFAIRLRVVSARVGTCGFARGGQVNGFKVGTASSMGGMVRQEWATAAWGRLEAVLVVFRASLGLRGRRRWRLVVAPAAPPTAQRSLASRQLAPTDARSCGAAGVRE